MREAVIVAIGRTAVGRAPRGTLREARPDEMAATVILDLLRRTPALKMEEIEDVILGCAMPEAEQGMNMARIASLRAGLPVEASAMTINRFCSSGLQAIALAAERIMAGFAHVMLAGGSESMSLLPRSGHHFRPNPYLVENYPDVYLNMGLTGENLARKYSITRDLQDEFSLLSHKRSLAAIRTGKFQKEIVPIEAIETVMNGRLKPEVRKKIFDTDEGPRQDTSIEALSKLRPVFHAKGTVTAGNSSQTSDGASVALVMSAERARELSIKPLARFVAFATAGVPPEIMGIGPVNAIPRALKFSGLKLKDIELVELNEAFAVQALSVIKEVGLDPELTNVNGGAIALGHPLGCTGAKLTASLLSELERRKARYGMVTMCIGGGMGAAGIFENLVI